MTEQKQISNKDWWNHKRKRYNVGLVLAGISAFILYAILGSILIAPHDVLGFEITIFTIFFQGIGYLLFMLLANVFYTLGIALEEILNKKNNPVLRKRLYNLGFWFSISLPFLAPVMIVVEYIINYA